MHRGPMVPRGDLNILIIEDNPDDALIMERALRGRCRVDFVESGTEGAKRAAEGNYDAVVLDYRLGDLTGTEVLLRIREKRQDLPVILASGTGSHFIVARSLALGAREFVSKDDPAFGEKLYLAIQHVVQDRSHPFAQVEPKQPQRADIQTRATHVKKMISDILASSDLVNTVGLVGPDGALIHGHIQDKSGAEDVTAVLAGTVQMMLGTVGGHLGYGPARTFVASFDKGAVAAAPLPGNLVLYFTSNAGPDKVDQLRLEVEAAATELARTILPVKKTG